MGDRTLLALGLLVGFLFGFNGIAFLLNVMSHTISEAQTQLSQVGAISTLVLFLIAVIIIVKVRILSSLIVGAIAGALINLVLEMNGIHVMNAIYSAIIHMLSLKTATPIFF